MNFMLDINSTLELWAERLLAASWQGGILLGLAWLLCRYVKPLSATAKCWIWRIAYLKFVVVLMLGGVFELPILQPSHSGPSTNSPVAVLSDGAGSTTNEFNNPIDHAEPSETAVSSLASDASDLDSQATLPVASPRNSQALTSATLTLFGLWLVGTVLGIALIGRQYLTANRIVRGSRRVTQKTILTSYRLLCSQLKMSTSPRLATTPKITTPMLVGAIRPTILLPTSLLKTLSPNDLRMIIAHELGHAKRRDLLWNWLLVLVRAIFFFHPLVWLTQKRFALDQEIACDQLALETTEGNLQQYSNLLVKCSASTSRGAARTLAAVGAVSSFKTLRERILEMNRMNRQPSQLAGILSAAVIITSLALVAPVKLVAQQRIVESDSARGSNQVEESNSASSSGSEISSASSGQAASNERKDVSVSVSNDGVRESIKVKWKNNGEVSVTYSSDANNQRTPLKYNLNSIEELQQENAAAYRFYKQHVTSTPGSVSARSGGARMGRGVNQRAGGNLSSQNSNDANRRYRTDDPPRAQGGGTGAGAFSRSSSASRSSSMGRNGANRNSNQSGSSSSSNVSGNANQSLIQQVRDMMEQTDDPMMQSTLRQMLDQLEDQNQNQNQGGQIQSRARQGQGQNRASGSSNQNRATNQGQMRRRR